MNTGERLAEIIEILIKTYPGAKIALHFKNPMELLVSTMLSAQCTDVRVNMVTPELFRKYKTAGEYAQAKTSEFENEIRSTGFFKNKTKNIIQAAEIIDSQYNGKVPDSLEELTRLPGIGRKTANVVLGNAYGILSGIVVDTHVIRLSRRLGLTKNTDAVKIEADLMELTRKKRWLNLSDLLISHGRNTCNARKPKCAQCSIEKLRPFSEKNR